MLELTGMDIKTGITNYVCHSYEIKNMNIRIYRATKISESCS